MRKTLVSVLDDRLLISGLDAGQPSLVLFSTVKSYRFMVTRAGAVSIFKLTDNAKVKLQVNSLLAETGGFSGLAECLQKAAEQYHLVHPTAMARDKRIF